MQIFKSISDFTLWRNSIESQNIGFVPTMGALHLGHFSLIKTSIKSSTITIVSIFVNKLQFGPNEDFKNYPRTIISDIKQLEKIGCDYAFIPQDDFARKLNLIKAPSISKKLCGRNRPGHFDGVLTIINKIFSVILPDYAFFGLKDYQQYILIREFAKISFPRIKIVGLPIIREKDGLAMSSRNNLLTKDERKIAPNIYENLLWIENNRKKLTIPELIKLSSERLEKNNIQIDYLGIFDKKSLKKVDNFKEGALIAVAAKIGKVRLIDNIILDKSKN